MNPIDAQLAFDAAALMDSSMGFGETIVYTPAGGAPVTIVGVVNRSPPEQIDHRGRAVRPKMTVDVLNAAATGIAWATLNAGDTLTLAYRAGGTPTPHAISPAVDRGDLAGIRLLIM